MRISGLFLLIALILAGCDGQKQNTPKGDVVFVSIKPQQFMIEQVAGDVFAVETLLPPGANPAVYEPSPGQLQDLSRARAYFRIGHIGFEKAWIEKIKSSNTKMKIYDQSKGVNFIQADHHHGHGHEHDHSAIVDPHIWMSPAEVSVQIGNITKYLSELVPDSASYFRQNAKDLKIKVADLDKAIRNKFEDIDQRTFMVYHPSLSYFARDYQLKQLPLEREGKEPSGRYMAEMIKQSKALGIQTVFVQKQFPVEKAEVLANELDASVEVIDPLAYNWLENMQEMASKIARALKADQQ